MFYGFCAGATEVALDPVPEMIAERTVGLVSLFREGSIELVMAQGPLKLCEPHRGGRTSGAGGARRTGTPPRDHDAPTPRVVLGKYRAASFGARSRARG